MRAAWETDAAQLNARIQRLERDAVVRDARARLAEAEAAAARRCRLIIRLTLG